MSDTSLAVTCKIHGDSHATFVCQHLTQGAELGFYYGGDKNDPRPDAWCGDCDRVLIENGGEWNDDSEAYAGVSLLCAACYDIVRQRNEVPFKRIRPPRPNFEEDGWELADARHLNRLHPDTFQIPSREMVDQTCVGDAAKLLFLFNRVDEAESQVYDERMWVVIDRILEDGYVGRLISTPVSAKVRPGNRVRFGRKHIISTRKSSFRDRLKIWFLLLKIRMGMTPQPKFRHTRSMHNKPE